MSRERVASPRAGDLELSTTTHDSRPTTHDFSNGAPVPDYPKIVVPPPGPKARAIVERDEAWSSTCYIKEYPLVVSRGQGVMVEDVDGNRYLDFMAGIAVSSTGYMQPKVVAPVKDATDRSPPPF